MPNEKNEMVLIDGYSLAYRAYYALPRFTTKNGKPTGAIYGFLSMLWKIIEECKPTGLVVAADAPRPTFRHRIMVQYKAQRKPMPEDMKPQLADIKEIIGLLGIRWVEEEGYEADDVIGSIVEQRKSQQNIAIVTSDRDLLQLVGGKTVLLQPVKGISRMKRVDETILKEEWGIFPDQVVDFVSMTGDTSDNIQGLPGVGKKTAARLLSQYGNWEGICSHLAEVAPRVRRTIEEGKEVVEENRRLVAIFTGLRPTLGSEKWDPEKIRWEEFFKKLDDLEFRKLADRIQKRSEQVLSSPPFVEEKRGRYSKSNDSTVKCGEGGLFLLAHPFPRSSEALKQAIRSAGETFFNLETALFVTHPHELPHWRKAVEKKLEQNTAGESFFYLAKEHLERYPSLEYSLRKIEVPILRSLLMDGCKISGLPLYSSFPLPVKTNHSSSFYVDLPLFSEVNAYTVKVDGASLSEILKETELSREGTVTTFYGPRYLGREEDMISLKRVACIQEILRAVCRVLFNQGVRQVEISENKMRFYLQGEKYMETYIRNVLKHTETLLKISQKLKILDEKGGAWTIGV